MPFVRRSIAASLVATALFTASPARASSPQGAPATAPAPSLSPVRQDLPLLIPIAPGTRVTLEVDARDDDLLGVVKQLLMGLQKSVPTPPKKPVVAQAKPKTAAGKKTAAAKPAAVPVANPAPNEGDDFLAFVRTTRINEVLKEIRHIHVVTVEPSAAEKLSGPGGTEGAVSPPTADVKAAEIAADKMIAFYEEAFRKEGGRRVLWSNRGGTSRILMSGFDLPRRNFALVVQSGPGKYTIFRADGYPNAEAVSRIISAFVPGM
ncbi:MAG: hypothetical protein H7Z41_08065 [Cytophagales bacterium]|nr:hypothetical protein [Armatimonadota bacterium]